MARCIKAGRTALLLLTTLRMVEAEHAAVEEPRYLVVLCVG